MVEHNWVSLEADD